MSLFAPWSAEKHPPKPVGKRSGLPLPGGKQAPVSPASPPRPNVPLGRAERFVTPSEQLGLTLANLPAQRYTTLVLRAADVDPASGSPIDPEAELVRLGMPNCAAEFREAGPAAIIRAHTSHECVRRLALCLRQDSDELKMWAWFIRTANQQLGAMPAFKGVVWKGIQTPPGTDPQAWYSPGQAFRWRSYVSAAKDKYTVPPCNVLVALDLDGSLAADVSPLSVQPTEGEVLIAPYQWFKVTESKLLNGTLVVSARTYTPPLREPGYHVLWRSDTFDADAKIQTEIVNLATKTPIIRSPVYFEKSNDFALVLLQHAEDDLEWKVIVSACCMRTFLPELQRISPRVALSAIVYSETPKEDLPFVLNFPFVTTITNQHHHLMSFVKCATLSSPEVEVTDSDTSSPGSSARSS